MTPTRPRRTSTPPGPGDRPDRRGGHRRSAQLFQHAAKPGDGRDPAAQAAPRQRAGLLPFPAVAAATVPPLGYDVSHPQCKKTLPADGGFAIVGINGGHPFSSNACVGAQLKWAHRRAGTRSTSTAATPAPETRSAYGVSAANDAVQREHAQSTKGTAVWWLDVEVANSWDGTQQENATVLDAMAAASRSWAYASASTRPQHVAVDRRRLEPGLPTWYATGNGTVDTASPACDRSFAGSATAVVQWVEKTKDGLVIDHNMVCPAFQHRAAELFDLGPERPPWSRRA